MDLTNAVLGWLFTSLVSPFFSLLGRGLELLLLRPLDLIGLPVAGQVAVVGLLAGLLSLFLRRLLRVGEHEDSFVAAFAAKKERQKDFALLNDWKTRDLFFRVSDRDLDEDFNTYLAHRFALHGIVYLLPILFTLFWLDTVFSPDELISRVGVAAAMPLPANSYGLAGVPVALVFFIFYLLVLFTAGWRRRRCRSRQARAADHCLPAGQPDGGSA
ncbi:MAG: hypothetical protein GXP57_07145 [Deltaproteobacteria bacterium]|nr:hypothetical protein [Deltaproteobacteria bacterium]